ncbi:MAG: hypothetical protein JWN24_1736 [Phycisphaerales bacterium]|nr:hypothetical protein [Phycisphaerales bacterium]
MRRRLFTLAAAGSLLLCVATGVVWVRSDDARSAVRFDWRGAGYALYSDRGRIGVDNSPAIDDFRVEQRRVILKELEKQQRLMAFLASKGDEEKNRPTFMENPNWITTAAANEPAAIRYAVPYWPIILVLLILPAIWLMGYRRSLIRLGRGCCRGCGYDLTGNTSGVCPECGTRIESKLVPVRN